MVTVLINTYHFIEYISKDITALTMFLSDFQFCCCSLVKQLVLLYILTRQREATV